jgi:predicted metal-dependent enzyme (double-stranded beta helix superfamily)
MAQHRFPFSPTAFLTQLAEQRRLWEPLITFDPWSRHYVRLAAGSGVEAWLLTWLPGQGTEWHDHGGSAGAFLTVRGALTERQAMTHRDGPPRIRPEVRTVTNGMLRPFGTKHVHRVTNEGVEPAVSLHAYAPALVEMNEYAVDGDRLRLVAAQRAGQSW